MALACRYSCPFEKRPYFGARRKMCARLLRTSHFFRCSLRLNGARGKKFTCGDEESEVAPYIALRCVIAGSSRLRHSPIGVWSWRFTPIPSDCASRLSCASWVQGSRNGEETKHDEDGRYNGGSGLHDRRHGNRRRSDASRANARFAGACHYADCRRLRRRLASRPLRPLSPQLQACAALLLASYALGTAPRLQALKRDANMQSAHRCSRGNRADAHHRSFDPSFH